MRGRPGNGDGMELGSLTVRAALDGLERKRFSSVDLTRAVLDAAAARDGTLGAYVWLDAADALEQAAAADAARAAGRTAPLLGLPLAVKDGYLIATSDFTEPVGPSFWERNS